MYKRWIVPKYSEDYNNIVSETTRKYTTIAFRLDMIMRIRRYGSISEEQLLYLEKDVNDYCRIFGSYWKKYGINKFVDYDDSVGTYDKYIFKNFKEWDWFESELGNYEKNVLFSDMESKNKMFSCDFDIIESVKKNKYSKTVKDSLLNYLDQEIKILKEREDLVLNIQFQDIPVMN